MAEGVKEVRPRDIDRHLDSLIELSTHTYVNQYHSLTPPQKRLIRALANYPGKSPYSAEVRQSAKLTQGNVQSALTGIKKRHLVDVEGKGKGRLKVSFDDPLFSLWLAKKFPARRAKKP